MWNDLLSFEFIESTGVELPLDDPILLESLFIAANEACVAYAPLLVAGAPVPESYKLAEIMQAAHIWSQFNGGNRDEVGADGYARPVYPLVFAARDLLRPKRSPLSRFA